MKHRRTAQGGRRSSKWARRHASARALTAPESGAADADDDHSARYAKLFRAALDEALARSEIVEAVDQAIGVDQRYLREIVEREQEALWESAEQPRQLVDRLYEQLRRRRLRLRDPFSIVLYELSTSRELRGAVGIAGLLAIAISLGERFFHANLASNWNRFLFYSGVALLSIALLFAVTRYVRIKRRRLTSRRSRRMLPVMTGALLIALAVIRANHLSQFRWANWLIPFFVIIVDGLAILLAFSGDVEPAKDKAKTTTQKSSEQELRGSIRGR
jgi:hypothetical protein